MLTVVVSVYATSTPGGLFDFALFAVGAWTVLVVGSGVRLVVTFTVAAEQRRTRSTLALWLVFPVVLVATLAVTESGLSGRLGLAAAKGDRLGLQPRWRATLGAPRGHLHPGHRRLVRVHADVLAVPCPGPDGGPHHP